MIKEIHVQFSDAVLHEAATRYGITFEQLKRLGGFESFVYEFTRDGQSYIMKLTHTIRRSENYIMGELEWLNFLADQGVAVSRAVPSLGGHLVERIEAEGGEAWLVIAYAKAPGHHVTAQGWNGELFAAWGRLMGRMHHLTPSYRLSNPAYKRQEWFEEDQLNARKYLPAHEAAVIARADELMGYIRSLPTPADAYGMLHTDLSHGNFYVDEGRITAFDFDDAGYNWFASDIAVALFSALSFSPVPIEDPTAFAQLFLTHFFQGYNAANHLDPQWLLQIRDFLLVRDLLLFIVIHQSWDVATWSAEQLARLEEHRRRILEARPLVDLDWMQFARR